jgi:hypothetical protein
MPSIFVAVPYTRPHYGGFVESLLLTEMPERVVFKQLWGVALDAARNYLIDCFLQDQSKPEFILFVDNDASFHGGAILRLIEHNLPMVCGCMYTTSLPPKPTMGQYLGEASNGKHFYKYAEVVRQIVSLGRDKLSDIPKVNALMFDEPSLMEVDGCGMHFTLIRRDVVEALRQPYFASLDYESGGGEDFYFCRAVRAAGFPIYADLSIHTGHLVGEREGAHLGLRELLLLARHSRIEDLVDVDGDNWIT